MSETIKLIIEIPKGVYEMCKDLWVNDAETLESAVAHGIPLDDVKAEIEASMYCDKDTRLVENANASGLKKALEIIDKHIGEEEKIEGMFLNVSEIKTGGASFLEEVGGEIGSSCEKFIRQMTGNEGGEE